MFYSQPLFFAKCYTYTSPTHIPDLSQYFLIFSCLNKNSEIFITNCRHKRTPVAPGWCVYTKIESASSRCCQSILAAPYFLLHVLSRLPDASIFNLWHTHMRKARIVFAWWYFYNAPLLPVIIFVFDCSYIGSFLYMFFSAMKLGQGCGPMKTRPICSLWGSRIYSESSESRLQWYVRTSVNRSEMGVCVSPVYSDV